MEEENKIEEENKVEDAGPGGKMKWIKRFGWGAFAFFFIKGLVWLAVFFGLAKFIGC